MGGGDHAYVGPNGTHAADTVELAFLQNAQQGDLRLRRQFPDLIQEDRAAFGQFETPQSPLQRSRKRPFFWPNNSDAIKSRGMAAQFTLTNAREARGECL